MPVFCAEIAQDGLFSCMTVFTARTQIGYPERETAEKSALLTNQHMDETIFLMLSFAAAAAANTARVSSICFLAVSRSE